jgi:hypothetical protein
MAKNTTPSFVTELRLRTSRRDGMEIDKALDAGRMIFNACLGEALRRLDLMRESKAYRRTLAMSKGKDRTKAFKSLREQYQFKDSAIQSFAIKCKNAAPHIGNFLDAHTTQKVATRTFNACNRYSIGESGRPRFKGKGQFGSLESKTNAAGIRYRDGMLLWRNIEVACIIDPEDKVIAHGLTCKIKFCRIVRRRIGHKTKYYMQLVVGGMPYQKDKNRHGGEEVGVDVGPSTIAYVGETTADLKLFCSELDTLNKRIRLIQRAMDRSRRESNPGSYKHNGTIKHGSRKWVRSEAYKALRTELADLHRRRAAYRKSLHGKMQNDILCVGNNLKIEKNSYLSFQKNFGKSVGFRAPSMFITGLIRKAENAGGEVWDIPAHALKLSQFCKCGVFKKKKLNERWHICDCGAVAQRDLFSAFLARVSEKQGDKYILDASRVSHFWAGAEPLMQQAVSRILEQSANGKPLPASFGIAVSSPRQSGSPVKPGHRTGTGGSTKADVGDAVPASSLTQREPRKDQGCFR